MKFFVSALLLFTVIEMHGQEMATDPSDGCPIFEMKDGDTVYVMKQYYMVFYKAGYNREQGEAETQLIQEGHMKHINKLGEDGYLSMAGPFGDNSDMRGILILNVANLEKVKELMDEDPAVQAGRLTYEIHPWWGAKGSKLN